MNLPSSPRICLVLLSAVLALVSCASTGVPDNTSMKQPAPVNAIELAQALGNGINLGNTMEAWNRPKLGTTASITDYETAWGQPVTSRAIISWFKKAGFSSIRIPVAWTNTMNYEALDYTIAPAYLDRVGEIIQYALDEDMYVIINDHWDGGWWGKFGSATESTRKSAMDLYRSMWTQIALRYQGFGNQLIFESANEELGDRLNDKDLAKDSGSLNEDQRYELTNKINQVFLDTVRDSGGNNANRYLLIAGYNTDIDKTCDPRFSMPTDRLAERLLISVHYYAPSDYCIFPSVNRWGNRDEYTQASAQFKKMTTFTKAGYGVVVGEYGVSLKEDGSVKQNTQAFLANVLDNSDRYGYAPMLWDCSSLYKRASLTVLDPAIGAMFKARELATEYGKTQDEISLAGHQSIGSALADAPEVLTVAPDKALAWIMFNAADYGQSYSVGDKYNPSSKSDGLIATDVAVTGAGAYTVSLDFSATKTGFANSVAFSALGIANGEKLFPGYKVEITSIQVNGQTVEPSGVPYTTSDDGICTRVNLYNNWVASIPAGIRVAKGDPGKASARLLSELTLGKVRTLSVSFVYTVP